MKPINPTRKQMEDMEVLQTEMHSVIEFIENGAIAKNKVPPKYEDSVVVYFLLKIAIIEDKMNRIFDKISPENIKN